MFPKKKNISGVPRASIIDLTLYNLYINDILKPTLIFVQLALHAIYYTVKQTLNIQKSNFIYEKENNTLILNLNKRYYTRKTLKYRTITILLASYDVRRKV